MTMHSSACSSAVVKRTLTPIDESVMILLICSGAIAALAEQDRSDAFGTACVVVVERHLLRWANLHRKQLLEKERLDHGAYTYL